MGFFEKMFGSVPAQEAEPKYSVKKLVEILNEWTHVAENGVTAMDNEKRDECLGKIVDQIGHLEKVEIEQAYEQVNLSEILKETLVHEIYQYEKTLAA